MKHWAEARAWRYLAGRWDKAVPGELCWEANILRLRAFGLCVSVKLLSDRGKLSSTTRAIMLERMLAHKPRGSGTRFSYWWPRRTKAGARSRAAFCRKMAKLAEKEG